MSEATVRLTVAQAVVRFLAAQRSERDGTQQPLFAGCFGIFGHGNVAGLGQALLEAELGQPGALPYYQARNEQAMVHAAAAFARMRNRLTTLACTSSIGPGATNLVTGAALATISRLPVLLLPGDVFAARVASPVLQELEHPSGYDVSVNDTLRPVSRFFDRIWRPEQLPAALLGAMRVLTDPAETGAVTLALPQDVQAEAWDWPPELFAERVWHVPRPVPEPAALERAVAVIRSAVRPLIVAGGGILYSEASDELAAFAAATGIPVAETQAGKGSLPYDHPLALGAIGSTGTVAANAMAAAADVVIGIGTRYSDFTTASRTAFADPRVRFVNLNVAPADAAKLAGAGIVADARAGLAALTRALAGWSTPGAYRDEARRRAAAWDEIVTRAYALGHQPLPAQSEVIGAVNEAAGPRDVVLCAAGSMPGDLHKLWRTRDPKGYHVEYGYSCMGYEIAGGLGAKLAAPDREVFVMVGDGSYLMMSQELVTAVQEGIKLIVVLVQNQGFASIGALSETVGAPRFGTWYRYRNPATGRLDGDVLPVDLAANAESLGVRVLRAQTIREFRDALARAIQERGPVLVHIETDPLIPAPDSESWWDVPVAQTSALTATRDARQAYEAAKASQRPLLGPGAPPLPESGPKGPVNTGAIVTSLCLGTAPDSWGVWFPADDRQVSFGRFLDELVVAGYEWVELGPYGYLPTDPGQLGGELARRGLRVCGGTTFGALHRPQEWAQTLATSRAVAQLTAAMGAHHLVLIPPLFRDEKTGAFTGPPQLDDAQWTALTRAANDLGAILLADYDIRLCLHPHADSHVQTQPEIERFLAATDPELVWLCLDTGHVAYGGGDNLELIRRWGDRIGYVHIKQMDPAVLAQVRAESLSFGEAVKRGVCVEPPAGAPDPAAIVTELAALDAPLFVVVEQDLYPCAPDVPLPIATRTREYLAGCGLRTQARPAQPRPGQARPGQARPGQARGEARA
ncbi:MAG TPA: 3D-(3,5/4)-trihydroxycyclohexane-1,2-dione acylhydrolase (decyclizing) [Streptosporangiaceae bacterium]|nr:3D-(3,5/4)-trihydroxycyclohexane-1,2-dione acylhydrolase (decyclizing) [Streptosporangiaceae bacterium]